MRKYLCILALSITALMTTQAQEFKVRRSTGKIILNLSTVLIEGYEGNEIIFSSQQKIAEKDPKEQGLQTINSAGYSDNSGLGISVLEKGTTVEVNEVLPGLSIKVLVPKGLIVSFICHKMTRSQMVTCRNMENEIEIETEDNNVLLENITGPVTVRALYGTVEAVLRAPVKGPVYITAIMSSVDISIPVQTKADLNLNSVSSTIMAAPDFKIEMEKKEESKLPAKGTSVKGKLNGGGDLIVLASKYGKIYLRKTK